MAFRSSMPCAFKLLKNGSFSNRLPGKEQTGTSCYHADYTFCMISDYMYMELKWGS